MNMLLKFALPPRLHLAVVAVAALLFASSAAADPPARVGRLAQTSGQVWFLDAEQGEWIAATRNRPLTNGDRLTTDRDARAVLQIGSTTLRVGGASEVELLQVDDAHVRVQLQRGNLAMRLRSREVIGEFEVVTPEGRFLPHQVGHVRIDRRDGASLATVWQGGMRFEGPDSALDVSIGQRAEFWLEDGVTHYTLTNPTRDAFGDWVLAEDREDERRAATLPVSPEMTGVDDLDRYGRWQQHAEYGPLWIPQDVAVGWAPYQAGHWEWVPPWGWTWIDDAPWGFAPFHYGRWVWIGGHWAWTPGRYVARPVYAPALVAWVGGPQVNVGISIGYDRMTPPHARPHLGWVPLAPREVYVPGYRVSPRYQRHINNEHDRDRSPRRRATGPIMYTNQGVPGGVTTAPSLAPRERGGLSGERAQRPRSPWSGASERANDHERQPPWQPRSASEPTTRPHPGADAVPRRMAPAERHEDAPRAPRDPRDRRDREVRPDADRVPRERLGPRWPAVPVMPATPPRPEARPDRAPGAYPGARPEQRPENPGFRSERRPDVPPGLQPERRPEPRPESRPAIQQPRSDGAAGSRPDDRRVFRTDHSPVGRPDGRQQERSERSSRFGSREGQSVR